MKKQKNVNLFGYSKIISYLCIVKQKEIQT